MTFHLPSLTVPSFFTWCIYGFVDTNSPHTRSKMPLVMHMPREVFFRKACSRYWHCSHDSAAYCHMSRGLCQVIRRACQITPHFYFCQSSRELFESVVDNLKEPTEGSPSARILLTEPSATSHSACKRPTEYVKSFCHEF